MTESFNSVQGLGSDIQLQALTRQLVSFLAPYDALLTPRWPSGRCRSARSTRLRPTPCRRSALGPVHAVYSASSMPSGQPGISLPLYQGEDGLPLGVQLVGRPAGEAALLALASQVEAALRGRAAVRRSPRRLEPPCGRVGVKGSYPEPADNRH